MTLMDDLRSAIKEGRLPPIFKPSDLQSANISDRNNNLSNYDKKNSGTTHEKTLVSRKIGNEVYYTLDEQVLEKLPSGNALNCNETNEGIRYYSPVDTVLPPKKPGRSG